MNDPRYIKSALFVDFDNIFIGLQQTDPRAAERFARDPLVWIQWLERSVAVPDGAAGDGTSDSRKRRLLVRRCYLNPRAFNRFRAFFIRSGFEVIDTPPLTGQGKTSADVHMVLDLVDSLHHPTRFDEFIVFSGDADFTPLLLRLRKHDRRTLVLAVGYASSAYRAACDHLIDQDLFVEEALGIEGAPDEPPGGEAGAAGPLAEVSAERAEVLARIGRRMREVVAMMGAIGAADVPQVYKEFPEFTSGENWLDFFSLRRMTEAVVEAAGDLEILGDDAWRVEPKRTAAPAGEPSAPAQAPRFDDIRDFVIRAVRESPHPVVLGAMAHEVVRRFGDEVKEHDWQYAGSFKAFLERLGLDGIEIAPRIPGHLYDPAVHGDFDPGDRVDPFTVSHPEIAELAHAVSDVTDTPYLTPEQYAVVFSEVAKEAEENGFQLTRTSKAVRDRCNGKGISVARSHISFLLKGLSFSGFRFTGNGETAERIGRTIYRNTLELCRRAQMDLSSEDERGIAEWLLGGLGAGVAESAARDAGERLPLEPSGPAPDGEVGAEVGSGEPDEAGESGEPEEAAVEAGATSREP